jgi:hypothetical protein
MKWFSERIVLGVQDQDIDYLHDFESVIALYSPLPSYHGVCHSPARLAQLQRSLEELWTNVLGNRTWLDSRSEVPC